MTQTEQAALREDIGNLTRQIERLERERTQKIGQYVTAECERIEELQRTDARQKD